MRRARIVRTEIGDRKLMMDANQVWDVAEAIANMRRLASFDPWWIEEPTSPDDVLGHAAIAKAIAPIRVATGEHCQNRIVFKQLLQAKAIGFCQVDACRLGGVNEVLAVLLLAAKFGVPVCPHAGGVGLCEYVQHVSLVDYIAVSGSLEDRVLEYVDHLHEHFVDPVTIRAGREFPATAADTDFIAGVVGWVDLTAADVAKRLAELRAGKGGAKLVGIRHQVHDEPDPEWLLRADVRQGIAAVGGAGLAYDLLVR